MSMNRFLLIKDVSEWTFHSSEDTMFIRISYRWLERILQLLFFLYQWKCILSVTSALLALWTDLEEHQLLRRVLIDKTLRIIPWGLHFMRNVIWLKVLAKCIFWSIGLWQWYINTTITIPDFIHLSFKTQLNSIGLSVPHRKHIMSPLRAQQVNAICRFVTMVY
jgi:hypothetical protein